MRYEIVNPAEWMPKIVPLLVANWAETGFDIVQDVWLASFTASAQVVYAVRVVNRSASSLNAQAQYLLGRAHEAKGDDEAAFKAYQVQYVDRLRQANGVDLATITVVPTDAFGNRVGPGHAVDVASTRLRRRDDEERAALRARPFGRPRNGPRHGERDSRPALRRTHIRDVRLRARRPHEPADQVARAGGSAAGRAAATGCRRGTGDGGELDESAAVHISNGR